MKLYNASPYHNLYLGDGTKLTEIPDKSVDMILTDPPWGVAYQSSHREQKFEPIAFNLMSIIFIQVILTYGNYSRNTGGMTNNGNSIQVMYPGCRIYL